MLKNRFSLLTIVAVLALLVLPACAFVTHKPPPKATEKDLERGWKYVGTSHWAGNTNTSFKTNVRIYLFKEMKEFSCQPYSPDLNEEVGERVFLKGDKGIGWHTITLRVRIVAKHLRGRVAPWGLRCGGEIADRDDPSTLRS